jgi:hypothetical protein
MEALVEAPMSRILCLPSIPVKSPRRTRPVRLFGHGLLEEERKPVKSVRRPAPAPAVVPTPEPAQEPEKDPVWTSELVGFLSRSGYSYRVCMAAVAWVQSRGKLDAHPEIEKADYAPANAIIACCLKREADYTASLESARAAAAELRRMFPPAALAPAPKTARGSYGRDGVYVPSTNESDWLVADNARREAALGDMMAVESAAADADALCRGLIPHDLAVTLASTSFVGHDA